MKRRKQKSQETINNKQTLELADEAKKNEIGKL